MDQHEDPDIISDQKTYLQRFFESKIFEHCWVQITRRKYDTLKYQDDLMKSDGDDLVSKINAYIADRFTHFYNVNVDGKVVVMVEMHVDTLYSYCANDARRKLIALGPYGGCPSVQKPEGKKCRLTFGQDEAIFRSSQQNENCWSVDGESIL